METSIDKLFGEYKEFKEFFEQNQQLSLLNNYTLTFKKIFLLACGSFFEKEIIQILLNFALSKGNRELQTFIKRQALAQKYHTLFKWSDNYEIGQHRKNANSFFNLFGDDFSTKAKNDISQNDGLKESIENFIEIGHLRNIVAHNNFAEFNALDLKTPEEVYKMYEKSIKFTEYLKQQFE